MWSLVTFIICESRAGSIEVFGILDKKVTQRHKQNLKDHFSGSLEDSSMRKIYSYFTILYTIGSNS